MGHPVNGAVELARLLQPDVSQNRARLHALTDKLRTSRQRQQVLSSALRTHVTRLRALRHAQRNAKLTLPSVGLMRVRTYPWNSQEEVAMPWANATAYPFNHTSVILNAPMSGGVYAIYNETTWVYVGETRDILAQLIQHLRGDVPCIANYRTKHPDLKFSYEVVQRANDRIGRVKAAISEFCPICNPASC